MKSNATTLDSSTVRRNSGRISTAQRILRDGLFHRLNRFTNGHLTLSDSEVVRQFGVAESTLRASLAVRNPRFYRRVAFGAGIGAARAYIDGDFTTDNLVNVIRLFAQNQHVFTPAERQIARGLRPAANLLHRLRRNTRRGSKRNIVAHYDLGNDFYREFLDPTLTYSCAIFEPEGITLQEASIEKLDRICRELQITADDHVLEIGTGWGSFALHAAKTYGCRVTTTTISNEQFDYVTEVVQKSKLDDRITVLNRDYRDLSGQYDKLVSIEMIEAVGHEYVSTFMQKCDELLEPGGSMMLQAITMDDRHYDNYRKSTDFIQHFVFPGACLVSLAHLKSIVTGDTGLTPVSQHDITAHYATTLKKWRETFHANVSRIRKLGFDNRFMRLWEYYLCYCEAGFRERRIGTAQLKYQKSKVSGSN